MPWCCCMFWVDLHSTLHVLILLLEHQNCLWLMVLMFSQVVVLCCRLHFIVYGPVRTKLLAATLSLLLDYWCHGWMLFSSLLDVLPRSYVLYHCQVLLHLFDELLLPFLLLHVSADTLLLLLHLYALVVHYSQVSLAYLRNNLIIFDSLVRAVCFAGFQSSLLISQLCCLITTGQAQFVHYATEFAAGHAQHHDDSSRFTWCCYGCCPNFSLPKFGFFVQTTCYWLLVVLCCLRVCFVVDSWLGNVNCYRGHFHPPTICSLCYASYGIDW